jgi:hypothetical protein
MQNVSGVYDRAPSTCHAFEIIPPHYNEWEIIFRLPGCLPNYSQTSSKFLNRASTPIPIG